MPPKFVKPPTVDTQDLMSTVTALVAALGGMGLKFAIVGGLACRLMGSQRYTQDVDVVIEVGEDDDSLSDISDRLGQRAGFVKDRIGRLSYGADQQRPFVNIDLLKAGVLSMPTLSDDIIVQYGADADIPVLTPRALLVTKLKCLVARSSSPGKSESDSQDLAFLADTLVVAGGRVTTDELVAAAVDLVALETILASRGVLRLKLAKLGIVLD